VKEERTDYMEENRVNRRRKERNRIMQGIDGRAVREE
jgi:hypothetical protein